MLRRKKKAGWLRKQARARRKDDKCSGRAFPYRQSRRVPTEQLHDDRITSEVRLPTPHGGRRLSRVSRSSSDESHYHPLPYGTSPWLVVSPQITLGNNRRRRKKEKKRSRQSMLGRAACLHKIQSRRLGRLAKAAPTRVARQVDWMRVSFESFFFLRRPFMQGAASICLYRRESSSSKMHQQQAGCACRETSAYYQEKLPR